jgi:hypothetical protein
VSVSALDAVVEADGRTIVVVKPHHGDLSGAGEPLTKLLKKKFFDLPGIAAGILLKPETTTLEALECYAGHAGRSPAFIHAGFADAKRLVDELQVPVEDQYRSSALSTLWT